MPEWLCRMCFSPLQFDLDILSPFRLLFFTHLLCHSSLDCDQCLLSILSIMNMSTFSCSSPGKKSCLHISKMSFLYIYFMSLCFELLSVSGVFSWTEREINLKISPFITGFSAFPFWEKKQETILSTFHASPPIKLEDAVSLHCITLRWKTYIRNTIGHGLQPHFKNNVKKLEVYIDLLF